MVGDKKTTRQELAELEASLAPAEAEVGAMAKADQNSKSPFQTPERPTSVHEHHIYVWSCLQKYNLLSLRLLSR